MCTESIVEEDKPVKNICFNFSLCDSLSIRIIEYVKSRLLSAQHRENAGLANLHITYSYAKRRSRYACDAVRTAEEEENSKIEQMSGRRNGTHSCTR